MRFAAGASLALGFVAVVAGQLEGVPAIEKIAPGTKDCAASDKECSTAERAASGLALGMSQYKIFSANQMAAVIALMAFESDDFKYRHNISPGRPGQGTANMQMANYNLMYAKQIDGVKDQVAHFSSTDGLSDDELNHILSLVTPHDYNFGSGPWFLTTQCTPDVRTKLDSNVDTGFQAYMACVGVTVTDDRQAYFDRAKAAFGLN